MLIKNTTLNLEQFVIQAKLRFSFVSTPDEIITLKDCSKAIETMVNLKTLDPSLETDFTIFFGVLENTVYANSKDLEKIIILNTAYKKWLQSKTDQPPYAQELKVILVENLFKLKLK
jgi:hypothetical protein